MSVESMAMWTNQEACQNLLVYLLGEGPIPTWRLAPALDVEALNLPFWPQVTGGLLQEAIDKSASEGLISRQIDSVIPEEYLALTDAGGCRWEAVSNPCWDRFWDEHSTESEATLGAISRERLESLIAIGYPWEVSGPIIWQFHEPFKARYWKSFASGWTARFRYRGCGTDFNKEQAYAKESIWHDDVWMSKSWPFR